MRNANELANSRLEELLSLDGRTAVVTGGASGIGRAIVERLHEAGARVVIGDLDAERAEAVAKDVDASGTAVIGRSLDASDAATIRSVADETVRGFGRLDIWVNNAGVHPSLSSPDHTWLARCTLRHGPLPGRGARLSSFGQ